MIICMVLGETYVLSVDPPSLFLCIFLHMNNNTDEHFCNVHY